MNKIALIGKAGSGKDTVAEYLNKTRGYQRYAFADFIKEIAEELFPDQYNSTEHKRKLLQDLGVKMREIDPDCWPNYVMDDIRHEENFFPGFKAVITDCRFENEYERCKTEGFYVIRIVCGPKVRQGRLVKRDGRRITDAEMHHVSEDNDKFKCDKEIDNNGNLIDLYLQLECLFD